MEIQFIFKWYDFWIGIFYDRKHRWIYILPFPTVGIILKLPPTPERKRLINFLTWHDSENLGVIPNTIEERVDEYLKLIN